MRKKGTTNATRTWEGCRFCGAESKGFFCSISCDRKWRRRARGEIKGIPMSEVRQAQGKKAKESKIKRLNGVHHCLECLAKVGFGMKKTAQITGLNRWDVNMIRKHLGIKVASPPSGSWKSTTGQQFGPGGLKIAGRTVEEWQKWAWNQEKKALQRSTWNWSQHEVAMRFGWAQGAREQWRSNQGYRIKSNLRTRLHKAISRIHEGSKPKHTSRTVDRLGCSIAQFIAHLESQFKRGMTWENYGRGKDKWHIDHIVACSHFDLSDPTQQAGCFHWSNMRPMWGAENIRRSNRESITMPLNLRDPVKH